MAGRELGCGCSHGSFSQPLPKGKAGGGAEGGGRAVASWLAGAGHPTHPSPGSGPGPTSCVIWDPEGLAHNLSCFAVLKLLKMAVGMRALLDTVMQALPQVAGRWGWVEWGLSGRRDAFQRGGVAQGSWLGDAAAPPPFLLLFSRWGTWDSSSCCCFSSLQLWAWSSLETWVSRGEEGGGAGPGGPGAPGLTRASPLPSLSPRV